MATRSPSSFAPAAQSMLRFMAGLLFLEHGTAKVLGYPPGAAPHLGFQLTTMAGVSGILELIGGILLVLGLFTRITAFILSGEMAVAYFMVHAPHSFFPVINKGEIAVLYCFVFLYLAVAGGGPWSLDALRHRA
jgi:putative oxidoreductase